MSPSNDHLFFCGICLVCECRSTFTWRHHIPRVDPCPKMQPETQGTAYGVDVDAADTYGALRRETW